MLITSQQLSLQHSSYHLTGEAGVSQRVTTGNITTGNSESESVAAKTKILRQEQFSSNSLSNVSDVRDSTSKRYQNNAIYERLVESVIETGITVQRTFQPAEPEIEDAAQMKITTVVNYEQDDALAITASGSVQTEDGRSISFMLELNYKRETQVEKTESFVVTRNLVDPIVINLEGEAPALRDSVFEFDITMDGQKEKINQTEKGTGFLVFDKNRNGVIDDGSEMFGPESGSGFSELSELDTDGNGWLDEADRAFAYLSFMDFTESGEQRLRSIDEVGIGAISINSTESKFDFYTSNGNLSAQLQRSSVGLMESGKVIAVQEIKFAVTGVESPSVLELAQFSLDSTAISLDQDQPWLSSITELPDVEFFNLFELDTVVPSGFSEFSVPLDSENQLVATRAFTKNIHMFFESVLMNFFSGETGEEVSIGVELNFATDFRSLDFMTQLPEEFHYSSRSEVAKLEVMIATLKEMRKAQELLNSKIA